ncbi:MAG: CBS domain-containing protein, partial [Nocardioidaceae bacterium]
TAREIMDVAGEFVSTDETLADAARKMRDLDIASLPICHQGTYLAGVMTDRDIVVRCIADGGDPYTAQAGDYVGGAAVTIGADESIEQALITMAAHRVRRLPVVEGDNLVGVLRQSDVTRVLVD